MTLAAKAQRRKVSQRHLSTFAFLVANSDEIPRCARNDNPKGNVLHLLNSDKNVQVSDTTAAQSKRRGW